MSITTFPWLSLGLLLASYSTFSWFLYNETADWLTWALVSAFALAQALLLTAFADGFRAVIDTWLQSDVGYFTFIIVSALLFAFVLIWINVFGYVFVLIAAEMLARLDLQNAGFGSVQAFLILTGISFSGLGLGQLISQLI